MQQPRETRLWICYVAVAMSLGAAAVHIWVVPEHFREWWGYGTFFLVAALAQGLYGIALLKLAGRWLYPIGIAGNLAIIVLYVVTRTDGIPLLGPHAGEVEQLSAIGMASKLVEIILVFALIALWRTTAARPTGKPTGPVETREARP